MNRCDNEATEEMIGVYTTFQIEEVKEYLDIYLFEGEEYFPPLLVSDIQGEIKTILILKEVLDQLIECDYEKARSEAYTEVSEYFIESLASTGTSSIDKLLSGEPCLERDFSSLKEILSNIRNYLWKWICIIDIIYDINFILENPLKRS